jgi:hypothetical protein
MSNELCPHCGANLCPHGVCSADGDCDPCADAAQSQLCPHGLDYGDDCECCIDEALRENHEAGNHADEPRDFCPLCADAAKECCGHPAGPFDAQGVTVFCDGSCVSQVAS